MAVMLEMERMLGVVRQIQVRAYQSPCIGTDSGPQTAQMPSFASRNQSGQRYCFNDSSLGSKAPLSLAGKAGDMARQARKVKQAKNLIWRVFMRFSK